MSCCFLLELATTVFRQIETHTDRRTYLIVLPFYSLLLHELLFPVGAGHHCVQTDRRVDRQTDKWTDVPDSPSILHPSVPWVAVSCWSWPPLCPDSKTDRQRDTHRQTDRQTYLIVLPFHSLLLHELLFLIGASHHFVQMDRQTHRQTSRQTYVPDSPSILQPSAPWVAVSCWS